MKATMFKTVLAALLITTFGYGQMVTGVTKDDWEEIIARHPHIFGVKS